MPSNFLIKLFLFLILPILIVVGFFVISTNYPAKSLHSRGAGEFYETTNKDKGKIIIKNDEVNLVAEDIIKPDENVKDIESDSDNESDEEVKEEEEIKEEDNKIGEANIKIIPNLVSWGYASASGRKIDTLIIHSSYDALGNDPYDLDGLLKEYKLYGVAPHYLIDRKGKIYQLVADKNIAYHAGVSQMPDGRTNINDFSIGIELMNTEDDKYTEDQYEALAELIDYLKNEHTIKYILGHSQIAPGRKTDPWNFDYSRIGS